jgi:hypothetical protein
MAAMHWTSFLFSPKPSAGGGGRVFLSHDPSMRLAGSYAEVLQSWRFKHGQLFLLLS